MLSEQWGNDMDNKCLFQETSNESWGFVDALRMKGLSHLGKSRHIYSNCTPKCYVLGIRVDRSDVWNTKQYNTKTRIVSEHKYQIYSYNPCIHVSNRVCIHIGKRLHIFEKLCYQTEYGMDWVETIPSSPNPRTTDPNPVQSSWWSRIWIQSSPIRTRQSSYLPNTL